MYAWQSIQETLDYIEEHYSEEIDIEELSSIAHLSMFYYQRLFNRLVGKNVYEYIRLRRLAKASTQLKTSNKRILDIALEHGFNTHGSFTKAFKDVYRITPEHYRNTNLHLDHFLKPDLVLQYTMIDEEVPLICDQMVLEIKRDIVEKELLFIGKSTQSLIAEISQPKVNNLVNQWYAMHQDMEYINSQTTTGVEVDILLPSKNSEYFEYFTGIQANHKIKNYDSGQCLKENISYVVMMQKHLNN